MDAFDSKKLLSYVIKLIREEGFSLGNIDSTICLQKPKIRPYISQMQEVLANCMQVDIDQISIKATTTEGLGFTGRKEGIAVMSNILVSIKS